MFEKIARGIAYPEWVAWLPRYRDLDLRDRLLDGTFYNHLRHAFYDEIEGGTKASIPITERRPSAQYRLPRMVSRWAARKLFGGRHSPRIVNAAAKPLRRLEAVAKAIRFWPTMLEAAYFGSVGSVAVTFRVAESGGVGLRVWRAKFCDPVLDESGDLAALRVRYLAHGAALAALGLTPSDSEIDPAALYWFLRDYTREAETTYRPVRDQDWDPVRGFHQQGRSLEPEPSLTFQHGLGFVPGVWIPNLVGGTAPDGACTWEDAIPNSIEIDYTLSQLGRGTRYSAAPQLVVKGAILNVDDQGEFTRGPATYIHLDPDRRDADGTTINGGDAKLLEMTGSGTEAGLRLIDRLRDMALEQIAASRKNPEKMHGPLSGRAMEYMDEDSDDLVMELRSQYGASGALPLLRRIVTASKPLATLGVAPEEIDLMWPRLFQPTPQDLALLIPALHQAVQPIGPPQSAGADRNASAQGNGDAPAPKTPPAAPRQTEDAGSLLTIGQARAYLALNMDLAATGIAGDDDEDGDNDDPGKPEDVPNGETGDADAPPPAAPINPRTGIF